MKRFAGLVMVATFAFLFFFLFFPIFSPIQLEQASAQQLRIKYDYKYERGNLGVYGIADTASAYIGDKLIAEAKALRIIQKEPGPNQLEVEETHFSPQGKVIYKGRIIFRFGFGGAHPEEQITISGIKRFNVFTSWPSGN